MKTVAQYISITAYKIKQCQPVDTGNNNDAKPIFTVKKAYSSILVKKVMNFPFEHINLAQLGKYIRSCLITKQMHKSKLFFMGFIILKMLTRS